MPGDRCVFNGTLRWCGDKQRALGTQRLHSFYKGRSGIINHSLNHDHGPLTHARVDHGYLGIDAGNGTLNLGFIETFRMG